MNKKRPYNSCDDNLDIDNKRPRNSDDGDPREKLCVFVAPVSGGGLSVQMAFTLLLCKAGIVPDIAMGVSGGAVALNMSMLCDFDPDKLLNYLKTLCDKHVVKEWVQGNAWFLPKSIIGLIRGSMFDHSEVDLFGTLGVDCDLSGGCEIWTAAFNRTQSKPVLFTNRKEGESLLTYTPSYTTATMRFLEGKYEDLRLATQASGAVPGVISEVVIDSEPYVDGGVVLTSCFPIFQGNLRELARTKDIHIVYISATNPDYPSVTSDNNRMLQTAKWAVHLLTSGFTDRVTVIDFIATVDTFDHKTSKIMYKEIVEADLEKIKECTVFLDQFTATVMEICPIFNRSIDYTHFTNEELMSVIDMSQDQFIIKMHWFE